MTNRKGPGQVKISFGYLRHIGPMFMHGGLTLQFESPRPYAFISRVQWPDNENYENAIHEAVEKVLLELQGHIETTLVILTQIEWDEINSSEEGFRRAAAAATRAAFDV
ncbi:hypothetical protein [Zavarzinia sp.]|uniref:hypothetical protein n=1 Tax=Zavarzinia sp. TaxID=2027920 RepID=UPI0035682935